MLFKEDEVARAEAKAVRENAGWYRWTHDLVTVFGADAERFLDWMLVNRIAGTPEGRGKYTTMLDERGTIIDDLMVFNRGDGMWWLSTLYGPHAVRWFDAHREGFEVAYEDVTQTWDMYAVQGPKSLEMVNTLVKNPVDDQKFFEMRANEIDGIPVYINRAGYTGEKLGFEVYYPKAEAPEQEKKLRALAETLGGKEVTEFQIMAWTLPCEAGFFYMRDLRHTNPFEVGLEGGINWEKDFIGKEALLKVKEEGAKREVVGFTVEEADIHIKGRNLGNEGEKVFVDGEEVGRVMKITYSYVNEINNGTIICKKGALKKGDKVLLHGHEAVICAPSFL